MASNRLRPDKDVTLTSFPCATELRAFADEHLAYEIDMLLGAILTSRAELSASDPVVRWFLRNVVVEAFSHHLRNLICFLYPECYGSRKGDVVVDHFLEAHKLAHWRTERGDLAETLKDAKRRVDKEMAHLTASRVAGAPPNKAWDIDGLASSVLRGLELLTTQAEPGRIGDGLRASVARLRAALEIVGKSAT